MLLIAPTPPQSDNTFTYFIIGVLCTIFGTVIGILVTLLIARKQRIRKEIAYEIITDAPIANINSEVKDKVEILFDSQPVKDMSLVVFRILNIGNRAISVSDYGKPLKFEFDGRTVKDANVLSTSSKEVLDSEEMNSFLSLEQQSITLKPLLLNPKDSITIKAFVAGLKDTIKGTARIAEGEFVLLNTKKRSLFGISFFKDAILMISVSLILFILLILYLGLLNKVKGSYVNGYIDWSIFIHQSQVLFLLFISAFLFIICIIGWIIDHSKYKKLKLIAYEIVSDTAIANIKEEAKDLVEIRYEGQPVKDMSLVVLKIWNKGGLAVRREDYDEPIRFEFAGRLYVTGEILSKEPDEVIKAENIKDFLKPGFDGSVSLPPFLLNPQESIKLKMLVTGEGKVKGMARIVDGRLIHEDKNEQISRIRIMPLLCTLAYLLAITLFMIHYFILYPGGTNFNIVSFIIVISLAIGGASMTFIFGQIFGIINAFRKQNFKLLWW